MRFAFVIALIVTTALLTAGLATAVASSELEFLDVELKNLAGEIVTLRELLSKPILIEFYATWCKPCTWQLRELKKVEEVYGDRVTFVLINVAREYPDVIRSYAEKEGIDWILLIDYEGELARRFNVYAIPRVILLASDGEVAVDYGSGVVKASTLIKDVGRVLGEAVPEEPAVGTARYAVLFAYIGALAVAAVLVAFTLMAVKRRAKP